LSYSTEERTCKIYGSITKSNYLTIKPDNKYYCVYLDTNDFDSNTKEIEIYLDGCSELINQFDPSNLKLEIKNYN